MGALTRRNLSVPSKWEVVFVSVPLPCRWKIEIFLAKELPTKVSCALNYYRRITIKTGHLTNQFQKSCRIFHKESSYFHILIASTITFPFRTYTHKTSGLGIRRLQLRKKFATKLTNHNSTRTNKLRFISKNSSFSSKFVDIFKSVNVSQCPVLADTDYLRLKFLFKFYEYR